MKKFGFRLKSVLFMIVVILVFACIFSLKKDITNNEAPKKATLVNSDSIGAIYYE